jgi:hypothetical protein
VLFHKCMGRPQLSNYTVRILEDYQALSSLLYYKVGVGRIALALVQVRFYSSYQIIYFYWLDVKILFPMRETHSLMPDNFPKKQTLSFLYTLPYSSKLSILGNLYCSCQYYNCPWKPFNKSVTATDA